MFLRPPRSTRFPYTTLFRSNAGSPPRVPGRTAGNWERGLRSLRDLTQHLTTRADDSHAAPVLALRRGADVSTGLHQHVKPRQGSSRCFELNHMLHRLCGPPSIPLSFSLAAVLPTRDTYCVSDATEAVAS